jgi:secreted trypsin-like serine protease
LTFQELKNLVLGTVDECWKDPAPIDPENWFCFGINSNKDMNACKGDSGGPVMVRKNNADGKQR